MSGMKQAYFPNGEKFRFIRSSNGRRALALNMPGYTWIIDRGYFRSLIRALLRWLRKGTR